MNWKKKITTCTLLLVITAVVLSIINKLICFFATLDNLLKDPEGNYYEWRFGKVFYVKQGSGAPILLVHDLTTQSSAFEWKKVISDLSKTNTVYAIDLLGCGRSDKPSLTYTNYLYVQMITDFIKHIIGQKTDVIVTGESISAIIMTACNDKTIIKRIIMINPLDLNHLSLVPTKRTKFLKFVINTPIIGTTIYNLLSTRPSIEKLFFGDYFYDCSKIENNYIKTYYEAAHIRGEKSKYLFASIKGRYTNANIVHCLKSLTNSIFILEGEGTPNNLVFAEQYKSILPSIEIIPLKKCKHLPQLEIPKEFLENVKIVFEIEE